MMNRLVTLSLVSTLKLPNSKQAPCPISLWASGAETQLTSQPRYQQSARSERGENWRSTPCLVSGFGILLLSKTMPPVGDLLDPFRTSLRASDLTLWPGTEVASDEAEGFRICRHGIRGSGVDKIRGSGGEDWQCARCGLLLNTVQ